MPSYHLTTTANPLRTQPHSQSESVHNSGYKNVLYLVKNGGIVTSLDPVSGKVYKQGRLRDALEHYYASPIAADGKIYAVSERGKVVVIQAGPQWQVLSTNDLAEDTYATPVVAGNRLYLRTMSTLYCFANPHD